MNKRAIIIIDNFSLPCCYEAEFKEQLEIVENGVPLEHLVSCLYSVELRQDIGSVKYIMWIGKKSPENNHEGNSLSCNNYIHECSLSLYCKK